MPLPQEQDERVEDVEERVEDEGDEASAVDTMAEEGEGTKEHLIAPCAAKT